MKKRQCLFIIAFMICSFLFVTPKVNAMTDAEIKKAITNSKESVKITVNGKTYDNIANKVITVNENGGGRTYVELREFCSKTGECSINDVTSTIDRKIMFDGNLMYTISMSYQGLTVTNQMTGSTKIVGVSFSKTVSLEESKPVMSGGIYVPLRFFANALGYAVGYTNGTVTIVDNINLSANLKQNIKIVGKISSGTISEIGSFDAVSATEYFVDLPRNYNEYSFLVNGNLKQYIIVLAKYGVGIRSKDIFQSASREESSAIYVVYKGKGSFPGYFKLHITWK